MEYINYNQNGLTISIGESGSSDVVSSEQINYQQKMFSHPTYRFEPQFPNTYGLVISLESASQTPSTINLPPEVFNLSQSMLLYSVTLPAGAAFIWTALQSLREISHLQFYSGSNSWICDIDNLQNYLDILIKKTNRARSISNSRSFDWVFILTTARQKSLLHC